MEAKNAIMPTIVEKWHAEDSIFITQTSCPVSCIKNHPEEEMHPKTIIAKNWNKIQCHFKTLLMWQKHLIFHVELSYFNTHILCILWLIISKSLKTFSLKILFLTLFKEKLTIFDPGVLTLIFLKIVEKEERARLRYAESHWT